MSFTKKNLLKTGKIQNTHKVRLKGLFDSRASSSYQSDFFEAPIITSKAPIKIVVKFSKFFSQKTVQQVSGWVSGYQGYILYDRKNEWQCAWMMNFLNIFNGLNMACWIMRIKTDKRVSQFPDFPDFHGFSMIFPDF